MKTPKIASNCPDLFCSPRYELPSISSASIAGNCPQYGFYRKSKIQQIHQKKTANDFSAILNPSML